MNLNILEQKNNILLSRKEISARITYDKATPSNEELKKQLATATKSDAGAIAVKHIYPSFGQKDAKVLAYVYQNAELMAKHEPKKKEKKAVGAAKSE